jgi:transcription antitermination factor NusG
MRRHRAGTLHLITVKTASERQVVRRLREVGVQAYSPRFLEFGSGGNTEHPLFPGYVFVWVVDQWAAIRATPGVREFVLAGGAPARVEQSIVDELRERETPYGYVRLYPKFEIGVPVRVGDVIGVYAGMAGRQRAQVLLTLLGRDVELSVPERDLVAA